MKDTVIFRYSATQTPEVVDTIEARASRDIEQYILSNYGGCSKEGERYFAYDRVAGRIIVTWAVVVETKFVII